MTLTAKQLDYLRRCAEKPQSSDVGAATVSSLRKLGYIEARKDRYQFSMAIRLTPKTVR